MISPSDTPARRKSLAAVRLRSCTNRPGTPADETVPFTPDPNRFQVGLCWHGSGGGRSKIGWDDDPRCIPVEILLPLLAAPNVQFTALHFADHAQKLQHLPEGRAIQSLSNFGVWDFAGTAGVMRKFDLVITVDTSVAHLAGTLAAQTWLMLISPRHPMFDHGRWSCLPSRYPSVRQYRQETPGDWGPVVEKVRAELAYESHSPGGVLEAIEVAN